MEEDKDENQQKEAQPPTGEPTQNTGDDTVDPPLTQSDKNTEDPPPTGDAQTTDPTTAAPTTYEGAGTTQETEEQAPAQTGDSTEQANAEPADAKEEEKEEKQDKDKADKGEIQKGEADKDGDKEGDKEQEQDNTEKSGEKEGEGQKEGEEAGQKEEGAAEGEEKTGNEEATEAAATHTVADGQNPNTRGDEDELVSEHEHKESEEPKIPDDFYYNFEDHVSKASVSDESGLPLELLSLHHSFGYDCQKRANLQILEGEVALFAAGNLVQLLNLRTREATYLRSTSGGGIGAIAVHPSKKYFAVGEKGTAPNINVFEYPSLKLCRIMRGGTQESYSFVDFSPDGKLLASVGGSPDYMLTLWDWKQEKTMLRSKAFSQDVFRVTFSTELEGQLTSSGIGHIRFWKMARTFTGLKLQGQLGKFGKTEISDIEGYVELPDGKVLSGSELGNLLLWDGGLIKVEISRKEGKTCHQGPISQIIMDEGELMTVGEDGCIRVWDFEKVDTADVTDDADIFEMEPMNELQVGKHVRLRSMVKSCDGDEPTVWFAQDANGGIWKLDLSFSFTADKPTKLSQFHSGVIKGCDTSPVTHLMATIGSDYRVFVYDYITKQQLTKAAFSSPGSSLLWVPAVVDPKGSTILVGFEDGVVRVLCLQKQEVVDVHGKKKEDQSELVMKQVFKPHNGAVTCLAVDGKGEILATGGADSTVFFFSVDNAEYAPIGFMKTPSPVTSLAWSPEKFKKSTLLVTCKDGQALEIQTPANSTFDTSHTFEITGLAMREHIFKSVKSTLRHQEELERKAKEEGERKKREEEERRKRIERGLETESDKGEQEKEEKEPEPEWEPFIPETPSPILYGMHGSEQGKVWLSMGDFDAGYLYEAEFMSEDEKKVISGERLYEPTRCLPVLGSNDVPVTTMCMTKNGRHVVMGMENGCVRIQPLAEENKADLCTATEHWTLSAHDNNYGFVSHVALSHDDRFLISVGGDGNIFVYNFMEQEAIDESVKAAKAKIPSARPELAEKPVTDIDDPNAYSIEDAKQKSEYDKMMKLAEQKKQSVQHTIQGLREQFRKLLEKNKELPPHLRLDRKEFEMDPEIKRQLERQTEQKIELVHREMAWEEEKHRIALEKLQKRFKDVVECERIVVRAFKTRHEVCSYRASRLPDDFYTAKAEMDKRKTTMFSNASDQAKQSGRDAMLEKDDGGTGTERENTGQRVATTLKGSMGERITKALQKVEEKKKKRAQRRAQWSELMSEKPDDNYESKEDMAAIKHAQENMGDYKLKSADDYVVPDHLRMNTVKARARLLQLKELLHQHKYDFNQRVLALRDRKIALISQLTSMRAQLEEVQRQLGPEVEIRPLPEVPQMHPDELPEKKYEYTRETLLRFKAELQDRKAGKKQPQQSGGFGGGFGNQPDKTTAAAAPTAASPQPRKAGYAAESAGSNLTPHADEPLVTPLEFRMREAEEIRLRYERDSLYRAMDEMLNNFDAELRCLRHEKFKLDIDLKNADLRHVTLFEEFLLLRDFEKHEDVLTAKLEAKSQEKTDMQNKILEVQAKLEGKKKDIEKLQEKEKALLTTFQASLGDNNKFLDYLTKVFKKKIKRSKKKPTDGADENEDSEEESSDESDWSESDEDEESESGGPDLDVCPPGCDQNIYDNTCALREKRLDIEEDLAEEKKNKEALGKELESFNKKSKVIDSGVKTAERELEAFQLEKQRKLNELDVVVTLKLHQIQHTVSGTVPADLPNCLVFEQPGVIRLTHRIKELEHEKELQKKEKREAKKKHVQLIKDRRVFDAKIGEMDEECNNMMIAKFGRLVDLEKLETVTVNRQVEELKEKLRLAEIQCSSEQLKWDEKIASARDEITNRIRANTNRLDQLNMLLSEKKDYEKELDSRHKNLGDEYGGVRQADVHERQRLVQLVHLQAQEIEALKEEITLLSRKGGHILPPAQPPLPHSAQARANPPT